jgi:hypothetical protein
VQAAASVTMWMMWMAPIALIILVNCSVLATDIDTTINLIYEFIAENKLKTAIAMACWKKPGSYIND